MARDADLDEVISNIQDVEMSVRNLEAKLDSIESLLKRILNEIRNK